MRPLPEPRSMKVKPSGANRKGMQDLVKQRRLRWLVATSGEQLAKAGAQRHVGPRRVHAMVEVVVDVAKAGSAA